MQYFRRTAWAFPRHSAAPCICEKRMLLYLWYLLIITVGFMTCRSFGRLIGFAVMIEMYQLGIVMIGWIITGSLRLVALVPGVGVLPSIGRYSGVSAGSFHCSSLCWSRSWFPSDRAITAHPPDIVRRAIHLSAGVIEFPLFSLTTNQGGRYAPLD